MKNIDHHHHVISIPIIIILISIGIAYLSWDSNDESMDGPVTSRIYKWEREKKTESEQRLRERERRRVIEGDSATMCE